MCPSIPAGPPATKTKILLDFVRKYMWAAMAQLHLYDAYSGSQFPCAWDGGSFSQACDSFRKTKKNETETAKQRQTTENTRKSNIWHVRTKSDSQIPKKNQTETAKQRQTTENTRKSKIWKIGQPNQKILKKQKSVFLSEASLVPNFLHFDEAPNLRKRAL